MKNRFHSWPFYLGLLPAFFVLHGFVENYPLTLGESLKIFSTYAGISAVLLSGFYLLFKNIRKAGAVSFVIVAFQLFFGTFHDFLKHNFGGTFITKYVFVLPFTLIFFIALIVYIKKSPRQFTKTTTYLNVLLIVLLALDASILMSRKKVQHRESLAARFNACDSCDKPDVYLILVDEYAGKKELMDLFSFDNSEFENELRNRDFHVVNQSTSNYDFTVYSMASLFNMQYIQNLEKNILNQNDLFTCEKMIRNNELVTFFEKRNYSIYNYSLFDFDKYPRAVINNYFPPTDVMLNTRTFTGRFNMDLGFHFFTKKTVDELKYNNLYNTQKLDSLTRAVATTHNQKPKFVYTHLTMLHYPYFFDRNGNRVNNDTIPEASMAFRFAYFENLLYGSKKILSLIDHIKKNSPKPPVICLMSDHGYRAFDQKVDTRYFFMTLNAVLLPGGNYSGFYDGMSNVNQFRVILNNQFGQRLPMLKDSQFLIKLH